MKSYLYDLVYEITNDILEALNPTDWEGASGLIEDLVETRLQGWIDDSKLKLM